MAWGARVHRLNRRICCSALNPKLPLPVVLLEGEATREGRSIGSGVVMKKIFLWSGALLGLLLMILFYSFWNNRFGTPHSTEIPKEYFETDVAAIISIRQSQDVIKRREALNRFVWGASELPSSMPSDIIENFKDSRYDNIRSLQQIDKVIITMEFQLKSIGYHFIPINPNNKIVLYHQGHGGDFYKGFDQIKVLVESGYAVLALSMPLLGMNNQPFINHPRVGLLKLTSHDHMKFLFPDAGHPIKYFIEPVVTAINYLETKYNYTSVSMVGISGGGWTATLAAAADTRIKKSFPVAGTYPIFLRSNSPRDWGDYEQNVPELYVTVNYLELYILGAQGENRKQLQIINKYDSCCFAGTKWKTYKDVVKSIVRNLGDGGEFDLLLDISHQEHKISTFAMNRIISILDSH